MMMKAFSRLTTEILLTLVVALTVALPGVAAQSGGEAAIRFVHVIPGIAPVDILVDGQLTISNLGVGRASDYVNLPAGVHRLTVTRTGTTTPLWEQGIDPAAGAALTLVAAAPDPLNFLIFRDDLNPVELGEARFTAINAIPTGPAFDILLPDGRSVVSNLEFNQQYGTLDIPAFEYDVSIVPAGTTLDGGAAATETLALNSGTSYTLVTYGNAASPNTLLLAAPIRPTAGGGLLQVTHAAANVAPLDVYINDTLAAPGIALGESTAPIALSSGSYAVSLRQANSEQEVASESINLPTDGAISALVLTQADGTVLEFVADDLSGLAPDIALINLVNVLDLDATVSASLEDGTVLATDAPLGRGGGLSALPPTEQTATITVTRDGTSESFDAALRLYGGVYYHGLVLQRPGSQPELVLRAASLEQGIASAPGGVNGGVVVVQADAAAPESRDSVEVVTAETDQGLDVNAPEAAPIDEPQVVPAPVAETQVVPAAQNGGETSSRVTARIVLNPDANLQLRQRPSAGALSLGLAPSGTVLTVNGREGAPLLPDGGGPDPEFVDPATLLESENDDLNPAETWLNVDYATPDGGVITAWVNAQFVEVRDPDGDLMRLANLLAIPGNQVGEARDTSIGPPPLPDETITAVVTNLAPGVNLHMRRTPGTAGESLTLLPADTRLELLGVNEAREWAFVRHVPSSGGVITGWVSTGFVDYIYRGRDIDLEDIEQRGLLTIEPDDTRGEIGSGAAVAPRPTQDPLRDVFVAEVTIDPGANLHLRRFADAVSESLGLIPSGTRLIIEGRDESGEWLRTEFEGQSGWIAAEFVNLTLNGRSVEVEDVPALS